MTRVRNTILLMGIVACLGGLPVKVSYAQGGGQEQADPLRESWLAAFMMMANQFTATMQAQVEAFGMFLDAKHQLETQRLFQEKAAEAHKDYQPSEQMCTFGTFVRDLAASERATDVTRTAVASHIIDRELGEGDTFSQEPITDTYSRITKFRATFCDPHDNLNGLTELCPRDTPPLMRNKDINYTTTLDQPLSLNVDLQDPERTTDEDSIFALVDNLFATQPLPRIGHTASELRKSQYNYLDMRSIVAMRGIARNSFANIISMKTATPNRDDRTNSAYLRALLREFGLQDAEIIDLVGENPSYYAQMEFLTKKIYLSPNFYVNLYDKPTNVTRMRAAMEAIKIMQDRDIHSALQRREMLFSLLLELRLRSKAETVYDTMNKTLFSNSMGTPGLRTRTGE